jgi:predicted MFS family arabinose efflux permease
VVFVAAVWVLGGYINTMANVLAPKLVPPQLKSAAAGNMAIAYQLAHFLGLGIATMVALLMYGSIAPHE